MDMVGTSTKEDPKINFSQAFFSGVEMCMSSSIKIITITRVIVRGLPFKFLQKVKKKVYLLLFEILVFKIYMFLHTLKPILETFYPL